MAESEAIINIRLANIEQALAQVRELRGQLEGLGVGIGGAAPMPGGVPGGGGNGVPGAAPAGGQMAASSTPPPPPMTPPTAVSMAGATAGTPAAAASAAASQQAAQNPQPGGAPDPPSPQPPVPPVPVPGSNFKEMAAAVGLNQAITDTFRVINQGLGMASQSAASGGPAYYERMVPGAISTTLTVLGTLAGFAIGGPVVAGLGALVASGIGGGVSALIGPEIEKDIANRRMRAAMWGYDGRFPAGSLPTAVAEVAYRGAIEGRPLPPELAARLGDLYGTSSYAGSQTMRPGLFNQEMLEAGTNALQRLIYDPAVLRQMGAPDSYAASADADTIRRIAHAGAWSDPGAAATALGALKNKTPADEAFAGLLRQIVPVKEATKAKLELGEAQTALATERMSLYGARENIGFQSAMQTTIDALREQLAAMRGLRAANNPDVVADGLNAAGLGWLAPTARERLRQYGTETTDAEGMAQAALDMALERQKWQPRQTENAEISAKDAYRMNQAKRDLDMFRRTGVPVASLPWGRLTNEANARVDRLSTIVDNTPENTPARYAAEDELGQAEHFRDYELPAQIREAKYTSAQSTIGLASAQRSAAGASAWHFGSAMEQATGPLDEQIRATRELLDLNRSVLETKKNLTDEERKQLATGVAQGEADIKRLTAARAVAAIVAQYRIDIDPAQAALQRAQISVVQGGAGSIGTSAAIDYAQADLSLRQNALQSASAVFGPNSQEALNARANVRAAQLALAQTQGAAGAPAPSAAWDIEMNRATTMGEFFRAGYFGSAGAARANIQKRLGLIQEQMGYLDRNRTDLIEQGRWGGDAAQRDYEARKQQLALQALDLQQQYDEGWDQRMISQVYSLGGNSSLARSQMTHREAALAGIYNRAFGGTHEQRFRARTEGPARYLSIIAGGNAKGMGEHGLAAAETQRVNVEVDVKVNARDAQTGTPLESTQRVVSDVRTANNAATNPNARGPF